MIVSGISWEIEKSYLLLRVDLARLDLAVRGSLLDRLCRIAKGRWRLRLRVASTWVLVDRVDSTWRRLLRILPDDFIR